MFDWSFNGFWLMHRGMFEQRVDRMSVCGDAITAPTVVYDRQSQKLMYEAHCTCVMQL